jgi:hypothetical protein
MAGLLKQSSSSTRILAILQFLFDDDDDEFHFFNECKVLQQCHTKKCRENVPKIHNYMEVVDQTDTIENVDDFKYHYRMCRQTFEIALAEIALDSVHCNTGGTAPISPDRQLLFF